MYKIIGYHGTLKSRAETIIDEGFNNPVVRSTNNHWLGHGIYFYKYFEHAKMWAEKKTNAKNKIKYTKEESAVIQATIRCEKCKYLDLDSPLELAEVHRCSQKLGEHFKRLKKTDINFGTKQMNLIFRCFVLDYYKRENNIDVITRTFSRGVISKGDKIYNHILPDLGYNELQICVTNKQSVTETSNVI